MATSDPGAQWRRAIEMWMDARGWTIAADVVKNSGLKPGPGERRPRIDASRMHSWLKGEVPRDADMLHVVAETFGVDIEDVLRAANYLRDDAVIGAPAPVPTTREAIVADRSLSEVARRMLLAAYDVAATDDAGRPSLRAAARARGIRKQ